MPRYAELPGGKRLSFDDKATDREIQRAVRRELGLEHSDLIDAVEKMTESVDGLAKRSDSNSKTLAGELTSKFADSIGKLAREVSEVSKDMAAAHDRMTKDMLKATSRNSDLMSDLTAAVNSVRTAVERVLDQSRTAAERAKADAADNAKVMDAATKRMADVIKAFIGALEAYEDARRTPKTVRRLSDGSYTIEVQGRRVLS